MSFSRDKTSYINDPSGAFRHWFIRPESVKVHRWINDNGVLYSVALPVPKNRLFGVVAITENQIQLVDALLNPMLE